MILAKTSHGPLSYLAIIDLGSTEQGVQRVVAWEQETSEVDKELASDVEEDQEAIETEEA